MRLKMKWSIRPSAIREGIQWIRTMSKEELEKVRTIGGKDHDRFIRILKIVNMARKKGRNPLDVVQAAGYGSEEDKENEKVEVVFTR